MHALRMMPVIIGAECRACSCKRIWHDALLFWQHLIQWMSIHCMTDWCVIMLQASAASSTVGHQMMDQLPSQDMQQHIPSMPPTLRKHMPIGPAPTDIFSVREPTRKSHGHKSASCVCERTVSACIQQALTCAAYDTQALQALQTYIQILCEDLCSASCIRLTNL